MLNKFKHIFVLLLVITATLISTVSCKNNDSGNGSDGETDNNQNSVVDQNVFWASGLPIDIVLGTDLTEIPFGLDNLVYDITEKSPMHKSADSAETKHEIIVGRANRNISTHAYRILSEKVDMGFEAYVIYSNGTSVAVAFSGTEALDMAIEELFADHLKVKNGKIDLNAAVLSTYSFNLNERYDELDAAKRAEDWAILEKSINSKGYDGKATVAALKKLYSLYSDDAYIWLANLYEPDIYAATRGEDEAARGGFYYSNSARNTISFLPDIESTRQAIDLIRYSGMTDSLTADLPKEVQNALVNFTRSLYDPNTGYYYHPQWADLQITDERRGRDYTNAKSVLTAFGAKQTVAASYSAPESALTSGLSTSRVQLVSRVVATASVPHLESESAFLEYLNKQNWNDSYTSGNRIAAQSKLIDEAGLMNVCLDFFDNIQNKDTGMWSPNRDDNAVNGFLKISAIYADYAKKYNRTLNYASEAAATCEAVLLSEVPPSTVCWVYNVWYSLGNIIGLLRSTGLESDIELANVIRDRLRSNAPKYIEIAAAKYTPFRKDDGSFSFTPGYSSDNSQGMPVCVSRMAEGDVNATYISIISVPGRIFSALGYDMVDVYTPNDMKVFVKEISGLSPVIKTNTEFGGALQFNGDSLEGLLYSNQYTEIDTEPEAVQEKGYAYAYIEMGSNNFVTFGKNGQSILESGEKVEPKLSFRTIENGGTRYIYEMRARFNSGEMEGNSWHTRFSMYYGSGRFWYILGYTNSKGQLCLDSLSDPIAVLEPGQWYTLRFEYYTDSAENSAEKICKIYVNDVYVGDGGVSGSAGKDTALGYCYMEYRCQATNLSWSIDDVNTTTDSEAYTPPPPPDFNDAKGKYYTDAAIKKTRFDYDAEDVATPDLLYNNNSSVVYVDSENGVLVFKKNTETPVNGEDAIKFVSGMSDAFWKFSNKTTVVEFDLKYKNISATTPMKWRFGNDIVVTKSGDSLALSMPSVAGNSTFNLETVPDTWYNIRFEQYWYKVDAAGNNYSIIKIFLNNTYVGEFKTSYDSATGNFMLYILASEASAELTMDNMIIAHIEKQYVSEDAPSVGDNPGASDEEYIPSAEILAVKGGANGIVVLMHDDGDIISAKILDSLYEKYGVKGDVAMIVSKLLQSGTTAPEVVTVNFWKQLINTGRWNIVNHSYTHTWWGNDSEALNKEIVTSQTILRNLFTTRRVLTYAYPGFSAKVDELGKDAVYQAAYSIVGQHYVGARDYDGRTSSLSGINWIDVNSCSIGEGWAGSALSDIDAAATDGKLAVVFMHRVVETAAEATTDTSATTKAKMEEILSKISDKVKDGKVWNAFFEEALLYLREAESASVSIIGDAESVKVNVTDALTDNETYNFPLSVRIEVPASWTYAKMTQGDRAEYLAAYDVDGKWVVDANIVPDGGDAILVPITKHDIPSGTTETLPKEEMLEMPPFDPGDANGDYFKNPDNQGLRVDYDSILTNIPEDTDAKSLLSIKDGYLLFDDGDKENSAKYIRYRSALPSGYASFGSLCTIFEFDMNLKQAYSSYPIQIKLGDNTYTIWYPKIDGAYKLCMQVNGENIPLGISMNTWATVRFEHYYSVTHSDGTTTAVLQVYVNNEPVLEMDSTVKSANNAALIYMTRVERDSESDADLKLDNIFLGHFDKAYEKIVIEDFTPDPDPTPTPGPTPTPDPEPDEPTESTDDANGKYFLDKNISGGRWDYDAEKPVMPAYDYTGTIGKFLVENGSLKIEGGMAEEIELVAKFWLSYGNKTVNVDYNTDVFEFDFMLTAASSETPMYVKVANIAYKIYKNADGTLSLQVGSTMTNLGVSVGEWATLRLEHYYGQNKLKIFVNNKYLAERNTGAGGQASAMIYLSKEERATESDANIFADNIYVGHLMTNYIAGDPSLAPPKMDAKGEYFLAQKEGAVSGKIWDYEVITDIGSDEVSYSGGYDKPADDPTRVATKTGSFAVTGGALKFEDGDQEYNGDMIAKYYLSYSGLTYNCTVFEFDFKIDQVWGSYPIQVKIGSNSNLTIWYDGGKLCVKNSDGAFVPLGTPVGAWSTIRFEAYYESKTIKIYVNNMYVVDVAFPGDVGTPTPSIYLTSNERQRLSDANLWVDNVYVGHLTKTFVAGDPAAQN